MSDYQGTKGLGSGNPNFCNNCGDKYHEINRLPRNINKCPKCFEKMMNGELQDEEDDKNGFLSRGY